MRWDQQYSAPWRLQCDPEAAERLATSEGVTQQLVQLPVEAERLKVKFVSINID
jgi:hypothetical protein